MTDFPWTANLSTPNPKYVPRSGVQPKRHNYNLNFTFGPPWYLTTGFIITVVFLILCLLSLNANQSSPWLFLTLKFYTKATLAIIFKMWLEVVLSIVCVIVLYLIIYRIQYYLRKHNNLRRAVYEVQKNNAQSRLDLDKRFQEIEEKRRQLIELQGRFEGENRYQDKQQIVNYGQPNLLSPSKKFMSKTIDLDAIEAPPYFV